MSALKLLLAKQEIARHLDEMCQLFTQPDDCKVTVVIRCPWLEDGDTVMSNDKASEAIKAIEWSAESGAQDG